LVVGNALLGGIGAGSVALFRGNNVANAVLYGTLGAVVAHGGRRIATAEFSTAGLLGRQVSTVGASVVHNAATGEPPLSRLYFVIGPLTVEVDSLRRVRLAGNLYEGVRLAVAVVGDGYHFELSKSLSAGAPVFYAPSSVLTRDNVVMNGGTGAGVIYLSGNLIPEFEERVFAHERVHVLQYDFGQVAMGMPLERRAMRALPWLGSISNHLHVGITTPASQRLYSWVLQIDRVDTPWEVEAESLEHR
jgi:hypothetical protein